MSLGGDRKGFPSVGNDNKKAYLKVLGERYRKCKKKERSKILNEYCATFEVHRKHAIRVLSQTKPIELLGKRRRKREYSNESTKALKFLWVRLGYMCSKKMVDALCEWMPFFSDEELAPSVRQELLAMSAATIDRELRSYKAQFGRSLRGYTGKGRRPHHKYFKDRIPIQNFEQKIDRPGYIQADTVAHTSGSMQGEFAWSLTVTDVYSGWTENRAVWNKNSEEIVVALKDIRSKLQFPFLKFNVDCGTEFLNEIFTNYFHIEKDDSILTRSRPYKKNDNCNVEQKNWTHVREVFGYERLDVRKNTDYMNEIYEMTSLLNNFFVPQFKLISKERVGSKYKKKYSKAITPYHRLLASEHITEEAKIYLTSIYKTLNPLDLRKNIEIKLKLLFQFNHTFSDRKVA